jgi:Core binding factor beta subunit
MSELPHKLAKGEHKVIISAVRDNPLEELKAAIDRHYVHVKFTETKGGTELGFYLDNDHSDLSKADFDNGKGDITLAGNLKLDGVPVRCVADVNLSSMEGKGHLEILDEEEYEEAKKKHPSY